MDSALVGTVGAGTFEARPGSEASGSVEIVAGDESGAFELIPHEISGPVGSELTLLPYVLDDGQTCADTGFRFSFGSLDTLGAAPLVLPSDLTRGDPSFFGSAVLTVYSDADREQHDCLATVVAAARIHWTLPAQRPDLEAVVDSGARSGAAGAVDRDAAGGVSSYTVAGGDTLGQIAERFGITVDDLFFLNPSRVPSPQDPTAYAGEVLNLSPGGR